MLLFFFAYPHVKRVVSESCERVISCRVRAFTLFPEIPWRVTYILLVSNAIGYHHMPITHGHDIGGRREWGVGRKGLGKQALKLNFFLRSQVAPRSGILGVNWFEEEAKKKCIINNHNKNIF